MSENKNTENKIIVNVMSPDTIITIEISRTDKLKLL